MTTGKPGGLPEERTRVDLGDDLLDAHEEVKVAEPEKQKQAKRVEAVNLVDELKNAEILIHEGLLIQAKKILHRLLIGFPGDAQVKSQLESLQKLELDQALDVGARQSNDQKKNQRLWISTFGSLNPELLLSDLERDFSDKNIKLEKLTWPSEQVFSSKDRVDLAIALIQAQSYENALLVLEPLITVFQPDSPGFVDNGNHCFQAKCLAAEIYLEIQDPLKAQFLLDDLLQTQSDLLEDESISVFYLLGRVQEAMGVSSVAKYWYEKAVVLDALFRDTLSRLRRLP